MASISGQPVTRGGVFSESSASLSGGNLGTTFVKSVSYDGEHTITVNNNTGAATIIDLEFLIDADRHLSDVTYNNTTEELTFIFNEGEDIVVDLASISNDTTYTLNLSDGEELQLVDNEGVVVSVVDLSHHIGNVYTQSGTWDASSNELVFTRTDATTYSVPVTTVGEIISSGALNSEGDLVLTQRNGASFTIDFSELSILAGDKFFEITDFQVDTNNDELTITQTDQAGVSSNFTVDLSHLNAEVRVNGSDVPNADLTTTTGSGGIVISTESDGTVEFTIGQDSIGGSNIQDDSIEGSHLTDGLMLDRHFVDNTISGDRLQTDSISDNRIKDSAIHDHHLDTDNDPTDGYVLQTKDDAEGEMTWLDINSLIDTRAVAVLPEGENFGTAASDTVTVGNTGQDLVLDGDEYTLNITGGDHQYLAIDADGKLSASVVTGGGIDEHDFLVLDDTPNSYSGAAGQYLRVNTDEDGIIFSTVADSGMVTIETVDGVQAITAIDDYVIRGFGDDYIEIASFTFEDLSYSFSPRQTLRWDEPLSSVTITASNHADFQSEYVTNLTSSIGGTEVDSTDFADAYAATRSSTLTSAELGDNVKDPRTGAYGGGAGGSTTISTVITTNESNTDTQTVSYSWQAAGLTGASTDIGNQRFDVVDTNYDVTVTCAATDDGDNTANESASLDSDDEGGGTVGSFSLDSGSSPSATISVTGATIYHDTDVRGTVSVDFIRPTTVSDESEANRTFAATRSWSDNPTIRYPTWTFLDTAGGDQTFAESNLGTLGNSGYSLSAFRSSDGSTGSWRNSQYTADNSANTGTSTYFIIAPSSIDEDTDFTNPNSANFPYSVTKTSHSLGHSGHTITYYVYAFNVPGGETLTIDVA